jgi:hypothetical protein
VRAVSPRDTAPISPEINTGCFHNCKPYISGSVKSTSQLIRRIAHSPTPTLFSPSDSRATHARKLLPEAFASVPFGFILVQFRVLRARPSPLALCTSTGTGPVHCALITTVLIIAPQQVEKKKCSHFSLFLPSERPNNSQPHEFEEDFIGASPITSRTRTRTNTKPNDTKASAEGKRGVRVCSTN